MVVAEFENTITSIINTIVIRTPNNPISQYTVISSLQVLYTSSVAIKVTFPGIIKIVEIQALRIQNL